MLRCAMIPFLALTAFLDGMIGQAYSMECLEKIDGPKMNPIFELSYLNGTLLDSKGNNSKIDLLGVDAGYVCVTELCGGEFCLRNEREEFQSLASEVECLGVMAFLNMNSQKFEEKFFAVKSSTELNVVSPYKFSHEANGQAEVPDSFGNDSCSEFRWWSMEHGGWFLVENFVREYDNNELYKNICLAFLSAMIPVMCFACQDYLKETMCSAVMNTFAPDIYESFSGSVSAFWISAFALLGSVLLILHGAMWKTLSKFSWRPWWLKVAWCWLARETRRMRCRCPVRGKLLRKQRRKNHLNRMVGRQQIRMVVLLGCMACGHARETPQILQQMGALAETATAAATAATEATARLNASSSTSTPSLEAATKTLKSPDTYNGEDPSAFMTWKMQLESWLSYGRQQCAKFLSKPEQTKTVPDPSEYSAEKKVMSQKFFAVLSSFLRGRCLQMVRSNYANKDYGTR